MDFIHLKYFYKKEKLHMAITFENQNIPLKTVLDYIERQSAIYLLQINELDSAVELNFTDKTNNLLEETILLRKDIFHKYFKLKSNA